MSRVFLKSTAINSGRGCGDYSCRICYGLDGGPKAQAEAAKPVAQAARRQARAVALASYNAAVPAAARLYLDVPRDQKDAAKALGARWDADKRAWYCDARRDIGAFKGWFARGTRLVADAPIKPVAKPAAAPSRSLAAIMAEGFELAQLEDDQAEMEALWASEYARREAAAKPAPTGIPAEEWMDALAVVSPPASPEQEMVREAASGILEMVLAASPHRA